MRINVDGFERDMTPQEEAEFNETVENSVMPPDIPPKITRRQFFQQLAIVEIITKPEALAAVATGTIPAAMMIFVEALPADQQFDAQMKIAGAVDFERSDDLVSKFGAMKGMSPSDINEFWTEAAKL